MEPEIKIKYLRARQDNDGTVQLRSELIEASNKQCDSKRTTLNNVHAEAGVSKT